MDPAGICFLWNSSEFRGSVLLSWGGMRPCANTGAQADDFQWSHRAIKSIRQTLHLRFHSFGTHPFHPIYKLLIIKWMVVQKNLLFYFFTIFFVLEHFPFGWIFYNITDWPFWLKWSDCSIKMNKPVLLNSRIFCLNCPVVFTLNRFSSRAWIVTPSQACKPLMD